MAVAQFDGQFGRAFRQFPFARDHDEVVPETMHFHKIHSFCTPLASGDAAVTHILLSAYRSNAGQEY